MANNNIFAFLKRITLKRLHDFPLSEEEREELFRISKADEQIRRIAPRLEDHGEMGKEEEARQYFERRKWAAFRRVMKSSGREREVMGLGNQARILVIRLSVAAAIIGGVIGIFAVYREFSKVDKANLVAQDFQPAAYRAMLKLGDGRLLSLDNSGSAGIIASQGTSKLQKSDGGVLTYNAATTGSHTSTIYNTLSTDKGQRYVVNLPDGTKVWLNAGSTLRFFADLGSKEKERQVELRGEAYFEVAANKSVPFKVFTSNGAEINVLGTHFNVAAYADEPTISITLLQGAVKVAYKGQSSILHPGQQAIALPGPGALSVNKGVDVDRATAWRKGYFDFNQPLSQVMRELSRWYDVKLDNKGNRNIDDTIVIRESREVPLSTMLRRLERIGSGKYSLVDSTIVVKPY
jgi:transmembrane sensor